ncbi:MAG: hypothetical protein JOZ45_12000, partial [Acidobacteriaceae bacterium]|nr:hypothetical protein [Acidobacteriaceae bacterium]
MATHIYTSVAINYLPKARVLAESIKKFHPDWIFHLVLCDETPEWFSLEEEPLNFLLTLRDLGIPDLWSWAFKHNLVELSTAVKGFALTKILDEPGCTEVFYFDPDIVVLAPLGPLIREFASASVLLTPHSTEPEIDRAAIIDNELTALRHGIFNLGFIGVKNSEEGRRFASWWRDRLQEFCYDDVPNGLFTDQRWADMVPAYFSDSKILRDPTYNVSTWNLTHRTITGSAPDNLLVNGQPLVFYHFSGFDSGSQLGMLKRYGSGMPALFELRDWYTAACERHGQRQLSQMPWAYEVFDNGQLILPLHRKRYRETPELSSRFPNPYATQGGSRSYLQWFEWHDELSFHTSSDLPPCTVPPCQTFLVAAPSDAEGIAESVLRLGSASAQRSKLCLVVSRDWEINFSLPKAWQILRFDAACYEDLFAAVVAQYNDTDMLIIRAGVTPPEHWDLRLAWSAARHPGVLAVSPLHRRTLDPAGTLSSFSDEELDRLCYWYREGSDPETASSFVDCVYLRAAAIKEITGHQELLRPSDLISRAAQFSYSHRLATHICCGWRLPDQAKKAVPADSEESRQARRLRDKIRSHAHPPLPISTLIGESAARLNPVCYDPQHYFRGPRAPDPIWERRLQLFWRAPNIDFSEDNSFTAAPLGLERQLVHLYFPEQNRRKLEELRLDLSAQSGFLLVHRISLLNAQDKAVWSWEGDPSFWESVRSTQVFPIRSAAISSGSLLYLTGDDPFLVLPIPAELLREADRGASVEVDLTLGTSANYTHD